MQYATPLSHYQASFVVLPLLFAPYLHPAGPRLNGGPPRAKLNPQLGTAMN